MTEAAGAFPDETAPAADGSPMEVTASEVAWRQEFTGLLHIGEMIASFEYLGHRISMRTLRLDDELIIAELIRQWGDTIGGTKSFATAVVGLAVISVDGQPMPAPLGETSESTIQWAEQRFNYARRWYPFTIDELYSRYLELEARAKAVYEGLGKGSTQADVTPGLNGPSASPNGEGSSAEPTSP